jgi:hypothetical protein
MNASGKQVILPSDRRIDDIHFVRSSCELTGQQAEYFCRQHVGWAERARYSYGPFGTRPLRRKMCSGHGMGDLLE